MGVPAGVVNRGTAAELTPSSASSHLHPARGGSFVSLLSPASRTVGSGSATQQKEPGGKSIHSFTSV